MVTVRAFSTAELAGMQATQDSAMQDTCAILAYTAAADAYGNPQARYEVGNALACGLQHVAPKEIQNSGRVAIITARLRLPVETALDPRDVIRVTYRYGAAVTTQYFDVVGIPRRGPSGLYVDLATTVAPPVTLTTSVWDDFNRTSLGSAWTTKIQPTHQDLTIISNQAGGAGGVGITYSAWWNARKMAADGMGGVRIRALPAASGLHLYWRLANPGESALTTYILYYAYLNNWLLYKYVGGVYGAVTGTVHTLAVGDLIALRAVGSTLTAQWSDTDGVTWTDLVTATDSSIAAAGYVGIATINGTLVDDFSVLEL